MLICPSISLGFEAQKQQPYIVELSVDNLTVFELRVVLKFLF